MSGFGGGDESALVNQRPARGVDQNRALFHAANVFGSYDAATARREDHVQRDGVGSGHQVGFTNGTRASFLRLGFGEIRALGDHFQVQRGGVAGHAAPQPTETDNSERFAGKAQPDGETVLEAAGPHVGVGGGMATAGLHTIPYRTDRFVVIIPKGHPLCGADSVIFVEMAEYYIVAPQQSSCLDNLMTRAAAGRPLRTRIRVNSFEPSSSMVGAG